MKPRKQEKTRNFFGKKVKKKKRQGKQKKGPMESREWKKKNYRNKGMQRIEVYRESMERE